MYRLAPPSAGPSRRRTASAVAVAAMSSLAMLLAACASLPDAGSRPPDVPVPARWSGGPASDARAPVADAAALAAWWRRFDDPALVALVEQALAANPDIGRARASLQQARALRTVAAAGYSPSVGVSASAQRSKSRGIPTSNLYQAGFDAGWEPDLFGATSSAVAAADADVAASVASLGDVQVSIAAETAADLIAWRGTTARLAIARANLGIQQETLQIAEWRVQAGLATSLESEQARAAAEQTRAQIPLLESTLAQAASSLAALTGRAPGELQASLAGNVQAVPKPPAELAASLPADTLRQRADLRAAEAQIVAASARVSQQDAARRPSVRLSGSIGLAAATLSGLTAGGALTRAVLGSIDWTAFDAGAGAARVESQRALLEQSRESYRATALAALKEVEDALVSLRTTRERLESLRRAAEAADNASLLARQRNVSGLVDFQTVLNTQSTLLTVQDAVASAEADLATGYVRLYKSLGGGWQPDAEAAGKRTSS